MNTLSISILAIRILALYVIVQGIFVFPAITQIFTISSGRDFDLTERMFLAFSISSPLIIGILTLVFSRKLGAWLSPDKTHAETENKIDMNALQSVAISVLGVLAITDSLPLLIREIAVRNNETVQFAKHLGFWDQPDLVASVVTLLIGIFLFFGSKFIVHLYLWSRYYGHTTDTKN